MMSRRLARRTLMLAIVVSSLALAWPIPPMAHAATRAITMAQYSFQPAALTIQVGDTVTWTNTDQAPHDVTTTDGPVTVHSPTLTTGESWSYTFTTPGTYSYICSIHPSMTATLTVRPAAVATAAPPTGAAVASPPQASTPMPAMTGSQQPATAAAASGQSSGDGLNPLLLIAGLTAAVATLCLLLLRGTWKSGQK